jgi:hypothetical protein
VRFKKGDVVKLLKVLLNGTMMSPTGIQQLTSNSIDYQYKSLCNFKENDIGIIISGPYYDYDCMMWELFINNDFWFIDDVHMHLLNEN